jgi:hypothetical protein
MKVRTLSLRRKRAQQMNELRAGLMRQFYPSQSVGTLNGSNDRADQTNFILGNLLGSFQRYAGNQKTAYDDGSVQSSPTSSTNVLERQVDRALTQVLGRSPGRGANNFINALNASFPQAIKGKTSSGQMVAYAGEGSRTSADAINVIATRSTEISSRQDALRRSTSIVMADAIQILERLQSFVPQADNDRVEALRSLVMAQIRPERVQAYLSSLGEYVPEFGKQAFLDDPALATIVDDEDQVTKFDLLRTYVQMMAEAWKRYHTAENSVQKNSLSERVDRARVALPVVAQATIDLSNALESVGLSDDERRSRASRFSTLDVAFIELPENDNPSRTQLSNIGRWLPDITVSDLIDWLDQYANMEAPSALDSVYGIDFVTDQADRLFWTIAPVVAHLKTTSPLNSSSQSTLAQVLSNERVGWALDNLLSQIHELANLGTWSPKRQ